MEWETNIGKTLEKRGMYVQYIIFQINIFTVTVFKLTEIQPRRREVLFIICCHVSLKNNTITFYWYS